MAIKVPPGLLDIVNNEAYYQEPMPSFVQTDVSGPADCSEVTQSDIKDIQKQIQQLNDIEQEEGSDEEVNQARQTSVTFEEVVPGPEVSLEIKNRLLICDLLFTVPVDSKTGNMVPASIMVDKQFINHKYQTLRTEHAFKSPSGSSTASINLTILFVGQTAINVGLRRLLAIFKCMPFLSIENDYVRSNLVPHNEDYVMACTLQDYIIRTVEGMPATLAVDVRLLWFNYLPYAPNFHYRRDWMPNVPTLTSEDANQIMQSDLAAMQVGEDVPTTETIFKTIHPNNGCQSDSSMMVAQPTKFASDSKLVRDRIGVAMADFKEISFVRDVMDDQIILRYQTFAQIEALDPSNVPPELPEPFGMVDVDTMHIQKGTGDVPPDLRMRPTAADALEELAANYYRLTGKMIVVNSCFRSRLEQIELQRRKGKEIAAENSWHEVGLAVDINVADLKKEEWEILLKVAQGAGFRNLGVSFGFAPLFDGRGNPITAAEATAQNYPNETTKSLIYRGKGKIKTSWETWHFDFMGTAVREGQSSFIKAHGGTSSAIRTLKQDQYRKHPKGSQSLEADNPDLLKDNREATQQKIDSHDQYLQGLMDKIDKLEEQGYVLDVRVSTGASLFFSKGKQLTIQDQSKNIIPQNISLGKSNIIANIPIVGHEYATQQFLGSSDMDASVAFIVRGTAELKTLQRIFTEIQYNSREFRKLRNRSVLQIENNIFRLCGFTHGLVESIRTETIDGMPDTYILRINLTQYPDPDKQRKTNDNLLDQSHLIPRQLWQTVACTIWSAILGGSNVTAYIAELEMYLVEEAWKAREPNKFPTVSELVTLAEDISLTRVPVARDISHKGEFILPASAGETKRANTKPVWESASVRSFIAKNILPADMVKKYVTNRDNKSGNKFECGSELGDILTDYATVLARLMTIGGSSLHAAILDTLGVTKESFPKLFRLIQDNRTKVEQVGLKDTLPSIDESVFGATTIQELQALNNRILPLAINARDPFLQMIASLGGELLNKKWKGKVCYPDLALPEHPIMKSEYATPPDYWFYNYDIDGEIKSFDLAKQEAYYKRFNDTIDSYVKLADQQTYENNFISRNKPALDKSVKQGQSTIGETERKKNALGAAMYPEDMLPVTKSFSLNTDQIENFKKIGNRQKVADTRIKQQMLQQNTSQFEKLDQVSFGASSEDETINLDNFFAPMANKREAIKDTLGLALANFHQHIYRLARAYPTFKITFIEEDETLNPKNFDDFYSYSAVQDIRIVKSHKNPADLCIISLVNIHSELEDITFSNPQSKDFGGKGTSMEIIEKFDPTTINTNRENPFSKLAVVEGSRIKVKLGYSNDPDDLSDEFNGIVVEVGTSSSSPDIVQLVCQGFGAELVAEEKNEGEFKTTQELLSSMICSPEVLNFGRWSRNQAYSPFEIRTRRSGGVNTTNFIVQLINEGKDTLLNTYNFLNLPQDDNIFAPDLKSYTQFSEAVLDGLRYIYLGTLTDFLGLTQDDRIYKPYKSTIWDIFKEMELRHPGFVALPLNYGNRSTMFFGPPYLSYWARPADPMEQAMNKRMNDIVNKLNPQRTSSTSWWVIGGMIAGAIAGAALLPGLVLGTSLVGLYGLGVGVAGLAGSGGIASAALGLGVAAGAGTIGAATGYLGAVGAGTAAGYAWNKYMTQPVGQGDSYKLQQELASLQNFTQKGIFSRLKPFRNYYILSSDHNIIANNVRVSSHGVFNTVQLTYMDSDPNIQKSETSTDATSAVAKQAAILEMKADDNILDKDIRVLQDVYPTCIGPFFARRYAVGLLMRSLRDMYKGEVVITGQSGIKPYDVVFFYDKYRDIYGPAEVEQVVQIFSKDTGWITEITPDLIVAHNNYTTMGTMEAMWEAANELSTNIFGVGGSTTAMALGIGAAVGTELIGTLGMALAAYGAYKLVQWTQCRQPVIITPLVQGSRPLVAGLNGYKRDGLVVNLRGKFYEFSEDVENGWNFVWNTGQISKYFQKRVADFSQ